MQHYVACILALRGGWLLFHHEPGCVFHQRLPPPSEEPAMPAANVIGASPFPRRGDMLLPLLDRSRLEWGGVELACLPAALPPRVARGRGALVSPTENKSALKSALRRASPRPAAVRQRLGCNRARHMSAS